MKDFEFAFKGTLNNGAGTIDAGIELLRGEPLDIANCLGMYADGMLKRGDPKTAIIVINAFKKFMELNPDMTEAVMKALTFNEGAQARIIRPTPDNMGNINPLKSFKGNKN